MKTPRTYRIIALLIMTLVVSPILSYSNAHAMVPSDPVQEQADMSVAATCHQAAENHDCKHCSASTDSGCCKNHADGKCSNNCGHVVVSAAISTQLFDTPNIQQESFTSIDQLTFGIDPDTQLRPPRFA